MRLDISISISISIRINGQLTQVASNISVAAALALNNNLVCRRSVKGTPRAPLCGMGICQECRVEINGLPHQLACQTLCCDGMHIVTQGPA